MVPLNDLEQLLTKPKFGPPDFPEMFRLLRETELVFLLPYHPEMEEGTMSLQNGDQIPPFVVWSSPQDGSRIPIFSSIDRAHEACRKTCSHEKQYLLCDMPGLHLFQILSCQSDSIALNPATSIPALMMDVAGVKEVARCAADQPPEMTGGRVQLLTAVEYPTELVHSLFQYLRECGGVRAAWLGKDLGRTEPGIGYIALVLGACDPEKIQDGIIIVAGATIRKGDTLHVSFLRDENAPALATAERFTPFYAAPDYRSATPLGPE